MHYRSWIFPRDPHWLMGDVEEMTMTSHGIMQMNGQSEKRR